MIEVLGPRLSVFLISSVGAFAWSMECQAQSNAAELGFTDLVARLGAGNVPTGAGVVMAQVEASETPNNYGPDQSDPEFAGTVFTPMSGAPGSSGHATTVGWYAYGNSQSIAPGVTNVYLYDAVHWLTGGFLRTQQGAASPPLSPPGQVKIINNSWAGSFGNFALDNETLRRADFQIDRDDTLMVNPPVNNFQAEASLMGNTFNAVTVGLTSGAHLLGPTPSTLDGPGRQRPLIVAPGVFTSYAAPYVDATAALLVETARTFPGLSANPNAQKSETLKAVLLAGGRKRIGWTNNTPTSGPNRGMTATPLDAVSGVDVVNVNNSHLILTGLEQHGGTSIPSAPNATSRGWDLGSITNSGSLFYRFAVTGVTDQVSIIATWHRQVNPDFNSFSLANVNLQLRKVNCAGGLTSITGDGFANLFSGNVVSQSAVDNVEHLFIRNLLPGQYVLQVSRSDGLPSSCDVAVAWLFPPSTPVMVNGDVTGNGVTNVDDLLAVINSWGSCPGVCPADIAPPGGNCLINVDDLLGVINDWG